MRIYKITSLALAVILIIISIYMVKQQSGRPAGDTEVLSALECIMNRKSVRNYTDRLVSKEQIDTLLRAAMAAPSGKDMRPWRFVVIDRREMLDTLAARLPYAKMARKAPVGIVVCGDTGVTGKDGKPGVNYPLDCAAAAENLLLAAEAIGLGAVWTGVYPYEDRMKAVGDVLGLPESVLPICFIPVGYPEGEAKPKDKYNADHIHYNGW